MSLTRVLIAAGILLLGNTTRASERAAGERTVGEALLEGVVVEVDPEVPDAELTKTWVEERARDVVASLILRSRTAISCESWSRGCPTSTGSR